MDHISIKDLLVQQPIGTTATLKGWVRNFRSKRFIALSDGSTLSTIQVVVNFENTPEEVLKKITVGACIKAVGDVVS